jgi:hypothetical protein
MQNQMLDISETKIGELLENTKLGDSAAMGAIINLFSNEIETLSKKAKSVGIPSDEARQIIITNFIERIMEGKI